MSKPVIITADSTCDLSEELLTRYQIRTIPLTILLGNESYRDGLDFTPDDMYDYYPADRIMHDISTAILAVQTQATDVLSEFPTNPAAEKKSKARG